MLLVPQVLVAVPDPEDHRHPVALDQRLEEVHERRVGARDGPLQPVLLLLGREVRREEEHRQVAVVVQRVGELRRAVVDLVEDVVLLGDLEQRPRVDLGDLFHYR